MKLPERFASRRHRADAPRVLAAARDRKGISIYGADYPTSDGTCVRDYIHVVDLAEAHILALDAIEGEAAGEVFNLGNGRGFSVRQVISTAQEVTGLDIEVSVAPRRTGDAPVLVASSDKARSILGWHPRFDDLRTILETAWRWHETHPEGYGN